MLLWQSRDISVDIVSETEEGSNEVIISVRNTAGSTLLFYENAEVTGKIEYLSKDGWVEYCDVSYTAGNADAVSKLYDGTFAELEPGEDWNVSVPEDKVAGMANGTYRIKMTYVTEKKYKEYLQDSLSNESIANESAVSEDFSEVSEEISDAVSEDISAEVSEQETKQPENDNFFAGIIPTFKNDGKEEVSVEEINESFLAESISEVFVKTFEYIAPESFVREISINDDDIDNSGFSKRIIAKEDMLY